MTDGNKHGEHLENRAHGDRGLWSSLWDNAPWTTGRWLSSWLRGLRKLRPDGRGELLRGLVVCAASLGLLVVPLSSSAFQGSYTGGSPNFCLPDDDSFDWGECFRHNFTVAQASIAAVAPLPQGSATTYVTVNGDTMTGPLVMSGTSISLTGSGGFITSGSSISASAFFGDGSQLTGIPSSGFPSTGVVTSNGLTGTGHLSSPVAISAVPTSAVDLSTVSAALSTKLSSGAVPADFINLSTVTTALATKAASGNNGDITGMTALTAVTSPGLSVTYGVSAASFSASGLVLTSTGAHIGTTLSMLAGATVQAAYSSSFTGSTAHSTYTITSKVETTAWPVVVFSTSIPCSPGVSTMTIRYTSGFEGNWQMRLNAFGVTTTTGALSILFDYESNGSRHSWTNQNGGVNGPFGNTASDACYLTSPTSTRWQFEQNAYMGLTINFRPNKMVPDHYLVDWNGITEQSSLSTDERDYLIGACRFNGPGSTAPTQITIQERASAVGQGTWCGDITLYKLP